MGISDNIPAVAFAVAAVALIAAQRYYGSHSNKNSAGESAKPKQKPMTELPKFNSDDSEGHRPTRRSSVAGESLSPEDFSSAPRVSYPKSADVKARLTKIASKLLLFRSLDTHQVAEIIDAMKEVPVKAREAIITQGDEGDFFYVVDSGKFDISIEGRGKVTEVGPGGAFGELALLYGQPRAATVTATVDSVVWGVDRLTFRRIVTASTVKKRKEHDAFLKEVPILRSLNAAERVKAVDALQPVSYHAGEPITTEGELGDVFYIVEEGEVVVKKLDKNGNDLEVARKKRGDYFGEIALLTDGVRVASVYAVTDVTCLALDKASFTRILGPCEDILKRNMANYNQYVQA